MTLYKGNKQFRKLHKGDELITEMYKGDELVYIDIEAKYGFKFTLNPKYNEYSTTTDYLVKFYIDPKSGYSSWPALSYVVDWGDGTRTTHTGTNGSSTVSASHTYAAAGEYQVTIIPNVFQNGKPIPGWLSGFSFDFNSRTANKILHYDTPLPEDSVVWDFNTGSSVFPGYWGTKTTLLGGFFSKTYHLTDFPDDFYDKVVWKPLTNKSNVYGSWFTSTFYGYASDTDAYNAKDIFPFAKKYIHDVCTFFDTSTLTNGTQMFYGMFYRCMEGRNSQDIKTWTIPADLFADVDTSNITNFSQMFGDTFVGGSYNTFEIPEGLLDFLDTSKGTNFSGMFYQTFHGYGLNNSATQIPANLFSHVDTSEATSTASMFDQTFSGYGRKATTGSIPATLFSNLDLTKVTNASKMFYLTFSNTFEANTSFSIPAGLFDSVATPNALNLSEMFSQTFHYHSGRNGVPANLFAHLSTSNCTNFSQMFRDTFWGGGCFGDSIPANFFNALDTRNGANFSQMFDSTFTSACAYSTTAVFPEHLFDFLDTSNATNMYNMFSATFIGTFRSSPVAEIPATLFQGLDTSNVTDFRGMFSSTFNSCFQSAAPNVPANLFSKVDVSGAIYVSTIFQNTFYNCFGTNSTKTYTIPATLFQRFCQTLPSTVTSLSQLFRSTFFDFCKRDVVVTVPATLFTGLNTSSVTSFYQTFCETFQGVNVYDIPLGLLGGLDLTAGTNFSGTFATMFSTYTGSQMPGGTLTYAAVFNDIFDGMTNFSWATAANAQQLFSSMFKVAVQFIVDASTGSASDILQHFNFVPDQRTTMFLGRTGLTDYATIDNNWK